MKKQVSLMILIAALLTAGCSVQRLAAPPQATAAAAAEPAFVEVQVEREVAAGAVAGDGFIANQTVQQRLVIFNASLSLVVDDPVEAVDRVSALASELGGFVVSSNLYETSVRSGDSFRTAPQADITIRVAAERLDEALDRLKSMAVEVKNESISGQDVTQEYTDLASRLRNLEAAEAQLAEIMEEARRTEDVLAVYNQLVSVREQIEVIKGQMQYFEQSARLSLISISLSPNLAAEPIDVGRWQPLVTAKNAVESLLRGLQMLADLFIYAVICIGPLAVVLGIPGYYVGRAVIRRRRQRAATAAK